jgi:hypothetical protein
MVVCDEKLQEILKNHIEFLSERTNSKILKFSFNEKNNVGEEEKFKIKDKSGSIFIKFN